jgi:GTPase SAR1 family protein
MDYLWKKVTDFFSGTVVDEMLDDLNQKKNHFKLLMIGPSSSGKTSVLYKLKLESHIPVVTIPTIGYNVEKVKYKKFNFDIFDMGTPVGLWKEYVEV